MTRITPMRRLHKWRNRMTCEVAELGGMKFRITHQRGKIVGLEVWTGPNADGAYGYTLWKGDIRA